MEKVIAYDISSENYDVIIIGGGVSGCTAAIAAARHGAKTLIIEKLPFLGGNMTSGLPWLGFHAVNGELVVNGLPMEIIHRLQKINGATDFVMDPITGSAVGVNGSMLRLTLTEMLYESGVDMRFHSIVTEVELKDNKITGVFVQSRLGYQLIRGFIVIDCTDNADVCVLAGADTVLGRPGDSKRQIASNAIIYGNIDYEEMFVYFKSRPDQIRPFNLDTPVLEKLLKQMCTSPIFVIGGFQEIIAKAKTDGLKYDRQQLIGVAYPCYNELMLVSSRVEDVDLDNSVSQSQGEINGLRQTWGILDLLNRYIPGCKNARIVSIGTQLGIRETRHVIGDYVLTAEDLLSSSGFYDSIAKGAYHMDIHSPDHSGLETKQPPIYQIPYRSLLVKRRDNLLVAGRCISATHEAMSSTRVASVSAAQGQAAGTAASLAVSNNCTPREVSITELQSELREDKAII